MHLSKAILIELSTQSGTLAMVRISALLALFLSGLFATNVAVNVSLWWFVLLPISITLVLYWYSHFVLNLEITATRIRVTTPQKTRDFYVAALEDLQVRKGWGISMLRIRLRRKGNSAYTTFFVDLLRIRNDAPINIPKAIESACEDLRSRIRKVVPS